MGAHLLNRLQATIGDYEVVREVRGLGMMIAVESARKVGPYLKTLMEEHGVIALPAGTNALRLLPPLTLSEEEIEIWCCCYRRGPAESLISIGYFGRLRDKEITVISQSLYLSIS